MLAIPLIGLIVTSTVNILDKRETARQFEILLPLAKVSIVASELIHELQKERGKNIGLITSGCNDINRGVVDEQRGLSDPRVANFFSVVEDTRIRTLSAEIDELVDELEQQTDRIATHLSAVDGREIAVPANVKSYTSIIKTLITIISKAVESSPSQELTHDLLAYVALLEAKEASGLERAIGATLLNNIAKGKFSAPQFNLYYGKFAAEESFLGKPGVSPARNNAHCSTKRCRAQMSKKSSNGGKCYMHFWIQETPKRLAARPGSISPPSE